MSTTEDNEKAVHKLARLLTKAAPLIDLLNSAEASHEQRALLRELVGGERYALLSVNLRQMCSWRTWEIAHAKDEAMRQVLKRPGLTGVSFDGRSVTFYRDGEAP
jgi:hypothetical protein